MEYGVPLFVVCRCKLVHGIWCTNVYVCGVHGTADGVPLYLHCSVCVGGSVCVSLSLWLCDRASCDVCVEVFSQFSVVSSVLVCARVVRLRTAEHV